VATVDIDLGAYQLGWRDEVEYAFTPRKGLDEDVIREMSAMKKEPEWMLEFRLKAYQRFLRKPIPQWGGGGALDTIDFDDIYYYVKPAGEQQKDWDMVPESIKATYEKLGIPEAERKYLAGVTAQYECLRGDVRVYTANRGMVPMKNIEAGDTVFSLDEQTGELTPAHVRSAMQTDTKQTYRVTVGSRFHRTIHATDNHPILTLVDARKEGGRRARFERRWKTVAELEVGDLVAVARDLPDFGTAHTLRLLPSTPAHFPKQTSADLMWLLGLWIGDGYTRNDEGYGTYRVEIAIPARDPELRAEVARVVENLFGLGTSTPDRWRVAITSKALIEWLEANGLYGTSHTKRFPEWVFGLPRDQRLAFLGGYIDADGYVSPTSHGNMVSITSVNRGLLADAEELARLVGLRISGPFEFESKHPFDRDRLVTGYRLGLAGDVERLDVRNPRRAERLGSRKYRHSDTSARGATFRAHTSDTIGFARVTEIVPEDVAPVYDIEVDGPHNFVAEGLIVHNSEVVYHRNREDLEKLGVLFTDMDTALREYPDIVKEYFGTVIPPNDNKFAALNSAVWSGGSFIYVPPGVQLDQPLQAYFRINSENMGQFERTLIIVDEGAYVHYVEGCSAPVYTTDSLHAAVVEIVVKENGRCRYTTIQNWSNNVFNLVTKRAAAYRNATMEWVDGNIGSRLTMKYPAVWLMEPGAHGEVLSIAFAGEGQHQDAGAKIIHVAEDTTSTIVSKSISKGGGRAGYRGLVRVEPGAENARSFVRCDALILDEESRSDTYPYMEIEENDAEIGHEATVSKVGEDQLFYLMSRGLTEDQATTMIVAGFIEPIVKELPMEYAVEMNRLIELNMAEAGAIG
jgi:Fe-S cluster assembly protein SufB